VNRGHRTFVTGVHGLEHVERFTTTTLTDDDPLRTHTQGVFNEVGGSYRPFPSIFGRACFQPDHVILLQLQFSRVLDRDDPFGRWE
jgi:hypothetical protein